MNVAAGCKAAQTMKLAYDVETEAETELGKTLDKHWSRVHKSKAQSMWQALQWRAGGELGVEQGMVQGVGQVVTGSVPQLGASRTGNQATRHGHRLQLQLLLRLLLRLRFWA